MTTPKLLSRLLPLLWIIGNTACTDDKLTLPEPAQSIAGVYEAQRTNAPFPVEGQVLRLTIKRVAADSVEVVIKATVGGQPGDSLVYKSALVSQEFGGTVYGKSCVSYRINLTPRQEINELSMTCKEENVFDYVYKPANSQNFTTVKFKKI